MEIWMVVLAAGVVMIIAAAVALRLRAQHRHSKTERLQRKFGSEYGGAIENAGRKKGEAGLAKREERVEGFDLRPLSASESERFSGLWTATQTRFVDEPGGAVTDAGRLLSEVMQARGYPASNFEQRAEDISVNHPQFVANYRAANAQAIKHSKGEASTEDLRQAMVHYRWLFNDLVGTLGTAETPEPELSATAH